MNASIKQTKCNGKKESALLPMEVLRKYLVPIAAPMLAAARAFVVRELQAFINPTSFDVVLLLVFLALSFVTWFWVVKSFSRIALQVGIGLIYAIVAATVSQLFFIALDTVLLANPTFFGSLYGIVGKTMTEIFRSATIATSGGEL